MKKFVSILFTTLLVFTMSLLVYAADPDTTEAALAAAEAQAEAQAQAIAQAQAEATARAQAIAEAQARAQAELAAQIQAAEAAQAAQIAAAQAAAKQQAEQQALQQALQAQAQAAAEAQAQATEALQAQQASTGIPAHLVVHRISNILGVYDQNGQLIRACIVSTGREGHRTPLGTYSIYQHATGSGYHLMVDGTYGRYCMRFKQGGYMFHSVCYPYAGAPEPLADEVAALGLSVSRGCVRLSVTDAAWLYAATPNGCLVSILDD